MIKKAFNGYLDNRSFNLKEFGHKLTLEMKNISDIETNIVNYKKLRLNKSEIFHLYDRLGLTKKEAKDTFGL